jgi:site-specific recombinase XerD
VQQVRPNRLRVITGADRRGRTASVRKAGITNRATSHTFHHSFATHLFEAAYDIGTVQELLGHKDVGTTMVYTHVLNRGGKGVRSPIDAL